MQNTTAASAVTMDELRAEVAELRTRLDAHMDALVLIVGEMPQRDREHVVTGQRRTARRNRPILTVVGGAR
jgi:hypothetical protein